MNEHIPDQRPGHYVDGRHRYGLAYPNQAHARAVALATLYGRPVTVYTRPYQGGEIGLNAALSVFWASSSREYSMYDSIDSPQEKMT